MYIDIIPTQISKQKIDLLYDYVFHYDIKDFPTLNKNLPNSKQIPILNVRIYSVNNLNFYNAAFGWNDGIKYKIASEQLVNREINEETIVEIAASNIINIEEYYREILFKMIDSELNSYLAHTLIYNPNNSFERIMYEKNFGKNFNTKPALSYTFNPDVALLTDIDEFIDELKTFFVPEIEIKMYPGTELDMYTTECWCSVIGGEEKYLYDFEAGDEHVPYHKLTPYLKNCVDEVCRNFNWAVLINKVIQENFSIEPSFELKEYLNKEICI